MAFYPTPRVLAGRPVIAGNWNSKGYLRNSIGSILFTSLGVEHETEAGIPMLSRITVTRCRIAIRKPFVSSAALIGRSCAPLIPRQSNTVGLNFDKES